MGISRFVVTCKQNFCNKKFKIDNFSRLKYINWKFDTIYYINNNNSKTFLKFQQKTASGVVQCPRNTLSFYS